MTAIFEQRDHAEVNPIIERTIVQEFGRPIPEDIVAIETPKPPGAKSSKTSKKRVAPKTESDEDAAPPGE